ncbi:MAG: phosphotransferase [Clostridiales bacterium]|nr:phosphotransferase [Clostridiales bacterium]
MVDDDIKRAFSLFFDAEPSAYRSIDTSRGESDFRITFIVDTHAGSKYVLKLADNDFTFPEKISVWRRTAEEYRKLGYYCPEIFRDRSGGFPVIDFRGHSCAVYAEEYAPYRPAADRACDDSELNRLYESYKRDIWRMTARVAAQYFDYTEYPSAYCLFETFCPSDKTDEVLENALEWRKCADALPYEFGKQVEMIWRLWTDNRVKLEPVYRRLPTSVFQADLNSTNILLDDAGRFVGVYDFNLCGRDVFLNYLMRECDGAAEIREALRTASECYRFSDIEKETALMLYRCLKPLWYTKVEKLKNAQNDPAAIASALDEAERALTEPIEFSECMG